MATLLKCSPFLGLKSSTEPYFLKTGEAAQASNVDVSYRLGSFSSAMGRSVFGTITLPAGYSLQCVTPLVSFSGTGSSLISSRVYVFSAINSSGSTYQGWYDPVGKTTTQLPYASGFTQAVQFGSALWTSGGDKIYYRSNGNIESDKWQIMVPFQYSYQLSGTYLATTGSAELDTYTYAITLRKAEFWSVSGSTYSPDPDSVQESSPIFSTSVTITSGQQPGITVPTSIGLQTLVSGLTTGKDQYYGCLYRSTSTNPTFQFIDYLANFTIQNDHNSQPSIIDTNAYATIENNSVLIEHQDAPPMLGQTYPGATANNSNPSGLAQQNQQVSFTYPNPCYVAKHKSRMWAFTLYPTEPIGQPPPTSSETISFQPQLWYSDESIPYSFDDVNGVLPVGPEDTPGNHGITSAVATDSPWATNQLEDTPIGLASTGSILVMFKTLSTWILLGDSPAEFNSGVRRAFDIGCMAPRSICEAEGGVFWLAPQGIYFFNGGEPSYIGEDVRGTVEGIAWSDRQSSVGSYRDRTFYLSFPASNITLCYYTPTKKWYTLPYACTFAVSSPFNQNQLLFINGSELQQVASSAATDLGSPIVSTWSSQITDSGMPGQIKQYSFLQVIAPVQQGTATVTLSVDSDAATPQTIVATWDLSKGNGAHVYAMPRAVAGYSAQVTIQTTTVAGATSPIIIRDVVVSGDVKHDLLSTNTPDLVSVTQNGTQIYPVGLNG